MSIKHAKVSIRADGSDGTLVQPSDWNSDHVIDELIIPTTTTPTIPPEGHVNVFGRNVGGRMMPAIVGPSGLDTSLQPLLARNSVSLWCAAGSGTTVTNVGASAALTATGTATSAAYALTNIHTKFKRVDYLVTTAAATAVAGARYSALWSRDVGFHFIMRAAPATGQSNISSRFFMGMANNTSSTTDVAPNSQTLCVGLGFDSSDTLMHMYTNDAAGTCTKIPLTGLPRYTTDRATMYELVMFAPPGGSSITYEVTDIGTNNKSTGTITTDLPLLSTTLAPRMYTSVGGVSSVTGCTLVSLYLESDF